MRDNMQLTHKFTVGGIDVYVPINPTIEQKSQNITNYGKEYGVSQLMWATIAGNTNVILSDDVYVVDMNTGEATFVPYELRIV